MANPLANTAAKVLGEEDGRRAVEAILSGAKTQVRGMLEEHRPVVETLRDALLEREELVGDEILRVISTSSPGPVPA